MRHSTQAFFKKGLTATLFKKGLIENGVVGVINRRNGLRNPFLKKA
ncbi:MAG TPA: hypothetical protein VN414_11995 [Methanosarcina sp.]|nr:hypothetical protein [Methanosarcina sp.]